MLLARESSSELRSERSEGECYLLLTKDMCQSQWRAGRGRHDALCGLHMPILADTVFPFVVHTTEMCVTFIGMILVALITSR